MQYQLILVLFALAVTSTVVVEDELGGEAFVDPGIVWRAVPPDWIHRTISAAAEVRDADLFISLDQQLYPYLLPHIEAYAETHKLTIAANRGTCGISAGLLRRKAVDIGGFCCPPPAPETAYPAYVSTPLRSRPLRSLYTPTIQSRI
jgi:hypothetical protein